MPTPEGRFFNPNVVATQRSLIRVASEAVPPRVRKIDLGLGELSYAPPLAVREAMHRAIDREGGNKYTPNNGIGELRSAIAQDLQKRHNVVRNPETDVIVTVGSTEALFVTLFTFAASGNKVIVPEIGYTAYASDARLTGLDKTSYLLSDGFEPDVDSIVSQLDGPGAKLVILNSPSNPTGHVTTPETIEQLAEKTQGRNDVVFLSDDIYEDFVYDGKKAVSIASYLPDQTVTVSGLSKSASITGYRLGWMSGPTDIMQQVAKVHGFMVSSADSVVQHGAVPVLNGECTADVERFREDLVRKRNLMMEELSSVPGVQTATPEGAFYCFANISQYGDSLAVSRRIAEQTGAVVIPGEAFGEAGKKYVRLSYAADDATIIEGVGAVRSALQAW